MGVSRIIINAAGSNIFYIMYLVTLMALAGLTDKCEVITSIQAQWG